MLDSASPPASSTTPGTTYWSPGSSWFATTQGTDVEVIILIRCRVIQDHAKEPGFAFKIPALAISFVKLLYFFAR